MKKGTYDPGVYDCFGLFTLLETAALFLSVTAACDNGKIKGKGAAIIKSISRDTLGVYLMHELIIYRIGFAEMIGSSPSAVLWLIPYAIVLFAVTAIVSEILRRIPFVGKYIC